MFCDVSPSASPSLVSCYVSPSASPSLVFFDVSPSASLSLVSCYVSPSASPSLVFFDVSPCETLYASPRSSASHLQWCSLMCPFLPHPNRYFFHVSSSVSHPHWCSVICPPLPHSHWYFVLCPLLSLTLSGIFYVSPCATFLTHIKFLLTST